MYVTFRNNSTTDKMTVSVENRKYTVFPEASVDVFFPSEKFIFEAQTAAFDELRDAIHELDSEKSSYSFKDRILAALTKKIAEKLPETALNISIKYEADLNTREAPVINLYSGEYSVCDGKLADFFDMMPVGYMFSQAETEHGEIKAVEATAVNRKEFLKLMRKFLLFITWDFLFIDLFYFIPEYLTVRFYASNLYINKLFKSFYKLHFSERKEILYKKVQSYEEKEKRKKGCLASFIKILIVLLALGGIIIWGITSEPEVIIAENFSSVIYFDETFVKINGLPPDAKDVFLENYTAYYPLGDGEYDMDNYYCYIYETPDGTRYMWLKDNCSDIKNDKKNYSDYENPLTYKSIGEAKD